MKKKKLPSLPYYDIAMCGPHVFYARFAEYVVSMLVAKGASVNHYSFLTHDLDELPDFADERRGEPLAFVRDSLPLCGTAFTRNDISGSKVAIKRDKRDCFYRFSGLTRHPVYCGTVCMVVVEYGKAMPMCLSMIISHDEKEAAEFLRAYYEAKRSRFRGGGRCILSSNGEKIEDFREMSWDDIIMPGDLMRRIRGEISSFFSSKKLYDDNKLDWRRGVLLAGPPGNGKTATCRAVATSVDVPVVYCAATDGDLFGVLNQAQATVGMYAPCILIMEDADSLGSESILRSALLNMLDGMFSCDGVMTIATTNCPEKLDSALTGRPSRFDSLYVIGNPAAPERERILRNKLGKKAKRLPAGQIETLAKGLGDVSAACVQEVAVCALKRAFDGGRLLTMEDLALAAEKVMQHVKISADGMESLTRGFAGFSTDEL